MPQATTFARRDFAVHSTAFIVVIVVIGVVAANLTILLTWLLYRRRKHARNAAASEPQTIIAPRRMSAHSDTKRRPGTGSSDRPSSAFSNSILAEKLGPLMPPQAHITTAPIRYTPAIPAQRPPAHRTRTSTSSRPSFDVHRSPHLTPAPPRRSNSSRRNILSQSASLRRAAGTPSNMSVADSASVYSTASAVHEQDAIAALPTVAERWRWRPRSQTPVLVLRNFREEDGEGEKAV